MASVLLALALVIAGDDVGAAAQRARWEQGRASQRAFEHRLFAEAGFQPIAEVEAEGRSVRRLLPTDPYGLLPIPGIEVERLRDGRVTLRLQHRGWGTDPVAVPSGLWRDLTGDEAAVYAAPVFEPQPATAPNAAPRSPPPICHGWIVRFAAGYKRTASWAGCGEKDAAAYAYALRMIEAAIATKPGCSFARDNPFWSFSSCFAAGQKLDDPALEARAEPLRLAYEALPGADRLSEARRGLMVPGLQPGTPGWNVAREAVARFVAIQDERRALLQRLQQLAFDADDSSVADRARLQGTIDGWSDFIRSQDANAAELLRQLAWPRAAAPHN